MWCRKRPGRQLVLEPLERRRLLAVIPVPSLDYPTIQDGINGVQWGDTVLVAEGTPVENSVISKSGMSTQGAVLRVPEDYPTIQDGIDAAQRGDTVLVAEGTYLENLTISNSGITVRGAGRGLSIIDGQKTAPALTISDVDRSVLVTGFTITNGFGNRDDRGGGIDIIDASPIIYDNLITGNSSRVAGGGISVRGIESDPIIINNEISNNYAGTSHGGYGGAFCGSGRGILAHNEIIDNGAWHSGGAIYGSATWVYGNLIARNWADYTPAILITGACRVTIQGNVVCDNFAVYKDGAGIAAVGSGPHRIINNTVVGTQGGPWGQGYGIIVSNPNADIRNNIVTSNEYVGISAPEGTVIEYTLVYGHPQDYSGGVSPGTGCISADPLFVDPGAGDFHLLPGSPAIDAGDPREELNDPDGSRNDVGAYGGPVTVVLVDRDRDGLSDEDELARGTDPLDPDSDDDRVLDGEEVWRYSIDPRVADTDQDQINDGLEIELGTKPLDPASFPVSSISMDLWRLSQRAFELTQTPFCRPDPQAIPALDPPPGGCRDCEGLTYQEYLAIQTSNVLDQDLFYVRPRVRGAANKLAVHLWVDDAGDGVYHRRTYDDVNPDYSSDEIRPAINPDLIPIAGNALCRVIVGHEQAGAGWPQFLDVGAEGYGRFNGHSPMTVGSSWRLAGAHNVFSPDEDFPIIRELYVTTVDPQTANLLALVDSEGFTGAVSMDLVPGPQTEIRVEAVWFPRRDILLEEEPETGFVAYSSMFWKDERDTPDDDTDEAHDVDTLVVVLDTSGDGRTDKIVERGINNPSEVGQIVITDLTPGTGSIRGFALENRNLNPQDYATYADAAYYNRASYSVEWVGSEIPLGLHLHEQHTDFEYNDNVVFLASIEENLHRAQTIEDGIHTEYVTKAFFPDQIDTDCGEIETLEISCQNVAVDGTGYTFVPVHTGRVIVDASFIHAAGNVDLELYGADGKLIAESRTATDNEQMDAFVEAGQTYRLVLLGDNPEVVVQVANLPRPNSLPVASDDTYSKNEDSLLEVPAPGVLDNDNDPDAGDILTVTDADTTSSLGASVTVGSDGSLTYDPRGSAALQALAGDESADDTFQYTIGDGQGGSDTATVTVTVSGVNDNPVVTATTTALTYTENDGAVPVDSRVMLSDADSSTLASATVEITIGFVSGEDTLGFADTDKIQAALSNGKTLTLAAKPGESPTLSDFQSALRSVTYENMSENPSTAQRTVTLTVDDGSASNNTCLATRHINVEAVNDPPWASNGTPTTDEDTDVEVDLRTLVEDVETADDDLTFAVGGAVHGTVALLADGHTAQFDPADDYNGPASFTYDVTDTGDGTSAPITVSGVSIDVTVNPINDPPNAQQGSATANEDAAVEVDLRTLVEDVETADDDLTFAVGGAVHGTVTLLADGYTARFDPAGNYNGPASFTYDVTDTGDGAAAPITVSGVIIGVTVNAINDPPDAQQGSATTNEDAALEVDLRTLVEDVETADDDLTFAVGGAVHGTVALLADGHTARFDPADDYNGPASFTYDVTDTGDKAAPSITVSEVTVHITVKPLKIDLALIPASTPSPSSLPGSALPTPLDTVLVGSTYYLEVWVQDAGSPGVGVTGGIVDLQYTTLLADATAVVNLDFEVVASGTIDEPNGLVDDLGGGTLNADIGVSPQWARLAYVEFICMGPGDVTFQLSPGELEFSRFGEGVVPWDEVDLSEVVTVHQIPRSRVDTTLVREPTSFDDPETGEVENLPGNLGWIDEWGCSEGKKGPIYVEIWGHAPDSLGLGISGFSLDLAYDSDLFTATSIEHGPALDKDRIGSVDDAAGRVHVGATTPRTDVGDGRIVLLARVSFEPTADDRGCAHNAQGQYITPLDNPGFSLLNVSVGLVDTGTAAPILGDPPDTRVWPVMYDIDDDGRIGFGDLAFFATAFQQEVGAPGAEFAWASDFDRSERVDVGDLAFFADNFGRGKTHDAPIVYPANFPDAWLAQGSGTGHVMASVGDLSNAGTARLSVGIDENQTSVGHRDSGAPWEVLGDWDDGVQPPGRADDSLWIGALLSAGDASNKNEAEATDLVLEQETIWESPVE